MSVKLEKGQKISLSKEKAGLSKIIVGLGWDEAKPDQEGGFFKKLFGTAIRPDPIDCDAFAVLLKNGKLVDTKRDVVYFNNLRHDSGAVRHMGDNLTGAGAANSDDEQIIIDLDKIPASYDKIVLAVNIYQAQSRGQHFGMVKNAFIHLIDDKDKNEICIYNLSEDYSNMTAMIFGELYLYNDEWKFSAIGQGTHDGSIGAFVKRYM